MADLFSGVVVDHVDDRERYVIERAELLARAFAVAIIGQRLPGLDISMNSCILAFRDMIDKGVLE